jgi:hypothetical protein
MGRQILPLGQSVQELGFPSPAVVEVVFPYVGVLQPETPGRRYKVSKLALSERTLSHGKRLALRI